MSTQLRKVQPELNDVYIPAPLKGKFPTWESYWKAAEKRLAKRSNGFKKIFDYLEQLDNPVIVETGTYREANNYEGDGCSTLLFDNWLNYHEGSLLTVDISEEACELSEKSTKNAEVYQCDSVTFLGHLDIKIDLLYLDSYNITDWSNDWPAAAHHLKELFAAHKCLKEGTLIVVDDNILHPVSRLPKGKGRLVAELMKALDIKPFLSEYQWAWVWENVPPLENLFA